MLARDPDFFTDQNTAKTKKYFSPFVGDIILYYNITPTNNRHRRRALINYSTMKNLTAYERNTKKIDNLLASGFYDSSVDAYFHIKNMEAIKQPMKDKLLTYLIEEQCDEELEMFLGRDHSTKNLF